jgi:aminomethyltransferase
MTSMLAQTPLHLWHVAHGGRMVDFAGWSMPVQYLSIVAEHRATREGVGLFDVSHMGRFVFPDPGGGRLLDSIVTRRVAGMKCGQIRYALITRDDGGILDDVLVYHLRNAKGEGYYQLVVNASNRQKILDWLNDHGARGAFVDTTLDTAMIAVQGPRAMEIVRPLVKIDAARLPYYHGAETEISDAMGIVSRTGYTGEDGCELIVPSAIALEVWDKLIPAAEQFSGGAAGLGARDTLRLEAGMPLYGHELTDEIDPFQAGLAFAVDLNDHQFPGRDALLERRDNTNRPRRAGWVLDGKRVPREGHVVYRGNEAVGRVTSGTFSPTLQKPIAMGYIRADLAAPGGEVTIDVRGSREPARGVPLPFYRRNA